MTSAEIEGLTDMSYVLNEEDGQFVDHETGQELKVTGTGSDMTVFFVLIGPSGTVSFTADKVFPDIADCDRGKLGLAPGENASVWRAYCRTDDPRPDIKRALLAYKSGYGFHYPNSKYFVQFGLNGDLQSA